MASKARRVGAVVGAACADAATRPLHWIYDQEVLKGLLLTRPQPEFWPTSESPFYSRPTGANSGYFDATLTMVETLRDTKGSTANLIPEFCKHAVARFGPGTAYAEAFERRQQQYDPSVRKQWTEPVEGPWLHGAMKELVEHFDNGKGSPPFGQHEATETDGFCASIPVIALHAGEPELRALVVDVITNVANSELCLSHGQVAAEILEAALLGDKSPVETVAERLSEEDRFPTVLEELDEVIEARDTDHNTVTQRWGANCLYPGNFMSACHAILTTPASYPDAVRKAITAGGCNCSRSTFVGAVLGAMHGLDGIPKDWVDQSHAAATVHDAIAALAED